MRLSLKMFSWKAVMVNHRSLTTSRNGLVSSPTLVRFHYNKTWHLAEENIQNLLNKVHKKSGIETKQENTENEPKVWNESFSSILLT